LRTGEVDGILEGDPKTMSGAVLEGQLTDHLL
jgi:hypothetical protein